MNVIGISLARLSSWIDGSYPDDMHPELVLRRRIDKLMEEVGETGQALGGYTGENPRKGVTHTRADVMAELLDVAVTALGAWEHMDGNRGRSGEVLAVKLDGLLNRVGLGAEPGSMMRAHAVAEVPESSAYPRRPFVCSRSSDPSFCPPLPQGDDETCTHTPTCPTESSDPS